MLLFKSCLFTPATHPERFKKAYEVGATLLLIDLEDSISPKDKAIALRNTLDYLYTKNEHEISIAIRVNDLNTRQGIEDVLSLLNHPGKFDFLLLPKFTSIDVCSWLDKLLTEAGMDVGIIGLIETATGVASLAKITQKPPRLKALMLGAADLSADLGCDTESAMIDQARNQLVQICAELNITAIDSPYFDIFNDEGLLEETRKVHRVGFYSKAAIHPRQISIINSVFTPTAQEIEYAKQVLEENEKGVGMINGKMIDEAIAKKARRILSLIDNNEKE